MTKTEYKNLFYDGFNSKLIETAFYDTVLEIPKLAPHESIEIPKEAIPFSKRNSCHDHDHQMLVFYESDPQFRDFVSIPQKYLHEVDSFRYISTPDCSVYRDMPYVFQLANIAVARSIGFYFQNNGKYVIPNVRWGDERTYTDVLFDTPPAFMGVPKHDVVSIGSYGCCKSKEDKYYLKQGLEAMIDYLMPEAVIVYGSYNHDLFFPFEHHTEFHHIPDWITMKKGCK